MRAAPSRLYASFKGYTMGEVENQAGHVSERPSVVYTNTTQEKMKEKVNML